MKPITAYPLNVWQPWFAWHPVRLTDGHYAGWVWLRRIYRLRRRTAGLILSYYQFEEPE